MCTGVSRISTFVGGGRAQGWCGSLGFAGLVVPFLGGLTFSVLRALALEFCFFFVGEKFYFSLSLFGLGVYLAGGGGSGTGFGV